MIPPTRSPGSTLAPTIASTRSPSTRSDTRAPASSPASGPARPPETDTPTLERLLTIDDVADMLQLSTRQVRRLTASGALSVVRIGKAVRVRPAALAALIGS